MDDFYTQSLMAGAAPDNYGGLHHTTASVETLRMNQESARFHNETMNYVVNEPMRHVTMQQVAYRRVPAESDLRPPVNRSFWSWLFND
jgi:hypothetical protein